MEIQAALCAARRVNACIYYLHFEVWDQIAPENRFRHVDSENLIDVAISEATPAGFEKWAKWIRNRYVDKGETLVNCLAYSDLHPKEILGTGIERLICVQRGSPIKGRIKKKTPPSK